MKMVENKGTVITSGNITPTQFRIKASRKAFEILSAGLYSNKVRAIVRELSTNAADAHIAAGKNDTPFEVHLPNKIEPWFAVTDYGIGLSDEAVNTVYTTYFDSDKTDSNDFTGCLGLGSKSPFSYTDSFTVESRFNGVKRVYSAYLSEDGLPSITKMTEESTTESNGLTVRFPVNSSDFYEFANEATETLKWFSPRPTVIGSYDFKYPEKEYLRRTDTYGVLKTSGRYYNDNSHVVMGNVAYPLKADDFLDRSSDKRLQKLVQWGIELYVNVGDVDISASREKLGYDKRTVAFLRKAVADAFEDLGNEITKEIAAKPTIWQAREALYEVNHSFSNFDFTAAWNGEKLNDHVKLVLVQEEDEKKLPALVEYIHIKNRTSNGVSITKEKVQAIHANKSKIFLNDERGAYSAVRRYLETASYHEHVYLISDYKQEWLDETGISEVGIKTSTLPKPDRAASGSRGSMQKAKVYEYVPDGNVHENNSISAGTFWKPVEIDLDEGGVYVEILYFSYRMNDKEATKNPVDLKRCSWWLKSLGKDVPIYGIRPSDKKLLEKSDGEWITFKDHVLNVLKEKEEYKEGVVKAEIFRRWDSYSNRERLPFRFEGEDQFVEGSQFNQYVTKMKEYQLAKESPEIAAYSNLRSWAGAGEDVDNVEKGYQELMARQKELFNRYPMLSHASKNYYTHEDDYLKDLADYINLVDSQVDSKALAVA